MRARTEEQKLLDAEYKHQWYMQNQDKMKERSARWYADNKDSESVKKARAEYKRQWYIQNRDAVKERCARRYAGIKNRSTADGKEAVLAETPTYYERNRDVILAKAAVYRKENPELIAKRKAEYAKANPAKRNARNRKWSRANRGKVNAWTARYAAAKLLATPPWADDFIISEAYDLAQLRQKATGIEWHVDHIVPLRGKLVCGLHTHHNIRVIPGKENISKNNRHWPGMP